jgi:hypothetical protein
MRSYLRRLSNWLIKPQSDEPDVDVEYLKDGGFEFKYITLKPDAERVRCDVCGKEMAIERTRAMISHVAEYDDMGAAEVDPLKRKAVPVGFGYEDIPDSGGDGGLPADIDEQKSELGST